MMEGTETISLQVESGALIQAPIWESRRGGRNWLAVISPNPRAPGGLDRRFLDRGRGEYLYLLNRDLRRGRPVEFGADLGHDRNRWYGLVLSVSDSEVTLEHHRTARAACTAAAAMAPDPDPDQRPRYPSLAEKLEQMRRERQGESDDTKV
jgi:hypothetical protein